ncbi:hypothetical protein LCGC14_1444850, partial [marine sediment metagenome]
MAQDNVQINTTAAEADLVFEINQHCLVRSAGNRYWAAYVDSNSVTGDLLIAYSDDGGATWTEETVVLGARAPGDRRLCLMINSVDTPIIVYGYSPVAGTPEIRYVDRSGGSWGSPETIHTQSIGYLKAVIDSTDTIHIAYHGGGDTDYITGTTGSWSSPEEIDDANTMTDIAVNSSNEPIACFPTFVRHRTGGAWAAASTFDDQSSSGDGGLIAVDSSDNWIVAWNNASGGTNDIYYRKYTVSWGTTIQVVTDARAVESGYNQPILILDTSDDAYIIYAYEPFATDETVWYKKIVSGTLGVETILTADILHPNTKAPTFTGLWHKYPASGVLPATQCPTCIILDEHANGIDANLKFFALEAIEEKGTIWIEGNNFHYFDENAFERKVQGHLVESDQDILTYL